MHAAAVLLQVMAQLAADEAQSRIAALKEAATAATSPPMVVGLILHGEMCWLMSMRVQASTETDLAYFGITDTLIERVEYMTYNTFRQEAALFHAQLLKPSVNHQRTPGTLRDCSDAAVHTGPSSPDFKLSAFQEKHVLLVLKNVEQLQHLRYALCPK